jgi:radical SAM PhpK family P-methyltransferase
MKSSGKLDCVIIGYNETPFDLYESFLRNYGVDTEAYRDLKFSFVDLGDKKLDYPALMNYVHSLARDSGAQTNAAPQFVSGEIPNLAAAYLTSYLRRRGFTAEYINLFQQEKDRLIEYLDRDPACVAITTTFYVVNLPVIEMVEFIRKHNSKTKIVVGGPLIANHARNYQGLALQASLDDLGADIFVIEGQGEQTLGRIIDCLKNDGDLAGVPNIAFVEDGRLQKTQASPEAGSLDENYIDWGKFGNDLGATIQTRTARSCAFNCAFCNYPTRAGKLTLASLDTVKKELDSIRSLGSVKNVVFIDDTFNVPLPRFKELCKMMIDNRYEFDWYSYFRCSNSDEEAIELAARSGCKGVFLGIESGSPTILKNMQKAATVNKYADGIRLLHQHGILTFGSFIVGFPGETDETVAETVDFIKEAAPSYYRTQLWYCEHGTPIDRQRENYRIDGEGFVWSHATMDSLTAMDHIDKLFLSINESVWLPQWSFDFWIIPYLRGKGIGVSQFRDFMAAAHKLLALEIAYVPDDRKNTMQQETLLGMARMARQWMN